MADVRGAIRVLIVTADKWRAAAFGAATKAISADADYAVIRSDYADRIFDAFISYMASDGAATRYRNAAGKAIIEDFAAAFGRGIEDGGGDRTDIDPDDDAWLTGRVAEEIDHLDVAFETLKELRSGEDFTEADIQAKADRWVETLDAVYSEAKLRAKKNQFLEWRFGDTDHCETCSSLNGQRHKASWYLARDYIPGKPGAAMDCGGYRCQCILLDKDGNEVTI